MENTEPQMTDAIGHTILIEIKEMREEVVRLRIAVAENAARSDERNLAYDSRIKDVELAVRKAVVLGSSAAVTVAVSLIIAVIKAGLPF